MELRIESDTTVEAVQKQFSAFYPFLKLEFFKSIEEENKYTRKKGKAHPELPGKKLRPIQNPVNFSVANDTTVSELLENFMQMGLLAQVCRKSGSLWVETSLTDDWTLERQNNEAMLMSKPHVKQVQSRG